MKARLFVVLTVLAALLALTVVTVMAASPTPLMQGEVQGVPMGFGLAVRNAPNGAKITNTVGLKVVEEQLDNGAVVDLYGVVSDKDATLWGQINIDPPKWVKMAYIKVITVTQILSDLIPTTTSLMTPQTPQTGTLTFGGFDRPMNCPTDGAMQDLFNLPAQGFKPTFTGEGVTWDHCKWNQGKQEKAIGLDFVDSDWEATVTNMSDVELVYYSQPGMHLDVKGFTLRYLPAYGTSPTKWANDKCEMLKREDAFGMRRNPAYNTVSGNINGCVGFTPLGGQMVGTAKTPTPAQQTCQNSYTAQWMKDNIGGDASKWTPPDWANGAWVFEDKGHPVTMTYPQGKLVVWIGGPVEVTSANASVLLGKTFDEASFHCK